MQRYIAAILALIHVNILLADEKAPQESGETALTCAISIVIYEGETNTTGAAYSALAAYQHACRQFLGVTECDNRLKTEMAGAVPQLLATKQTNPELYNKQFAGIERWAKACIAKYNQIAQ